jgi:predicted transcriptional regulator
MRRCSTYVLHSRADLKAERTTMSTTTVRLPDELKKRLADVAEQAGMTSHALILQAISDRVEADEARNRLYDEAERRYALIAETGQSIPWSEMRRYLERRVADETTEPPTARPLSE